MTNQAVLDALDAKKHPAKAEQLFYLLKALATDNIVHSPTDAVQPHFTKPTVYTYFRRLEEAGAILRVVNGKSIAQIKLLKDEVSIPLGRRGRKPGAKPNNNKNDTDVNLEAPAKTDLKEIKRSRAVAFIDENQLIQADKSGLEFSLPKIVKAINDNIGELQRIYVYISEVTERNNKTAAERIFGCDDPRVRYIKTGNQPDMADRRIKEDMIFWSQNNLADVFVLATADGGPDFMDAISEVKNNDHLLVIMKIAGNASHKLMAKADYSITVQMETPRSNIFARIVEEANGGKFNEHDRNSLFVLTVFMGLNEFFQSAKEGQFMRIVGFIYDNIVSKMREFDDYGRFDVRDVLGAIANLGDGLVWRRDEEEKKMYSLPARQSMAAEVFSMYAEAEE